VNAKAFDGHAASIREAIIGSYAEFYIGTLLVGAEKEGVNPLVMELFRESDKRIRRVPDNSPDAAKYVEAEYATGEDIEIVRYSAPARVIRDRLELTGFTLRTAVAAFERAVKSEQARHRKMFESIQSQLGHSLEDEDGPVLQQLTVEEWRKGLVTIRDQDLRSMNNQDPRLAWISTEGKFAKREMPLAG
jgi:hypothetical protein